MNNEGSPDHGAVALLALIKSLTTPDLRLLSAGVIPAGMRGALKICCADELRRRGFLMNEEKA